MIDLKNVPENKPVLIAGPTASGKSALALQIAKEQGGVILNADALQVYQGWPILSAQPPLEDLSQAEHRLYGHLPFDSSYSVGQWLAEIATFVADWRRGGPRPIIIGGTGLYFSALTEGLSDIPTTPDDIRKAGDLLTLSQLISQTDSETLNGLDRANRARVQRAWEVEHSTGKPLLYWQGKKQPPLLDLEACTALLLNAPKEWLTPRIEQRFDLMLAAGAIEEAHAMRPHWSPSHLSSRTIGAAEMIAHIDGDRDLDSVREAVIIGSRQYAKRQRTWFKSRMSRWSQVTPQSVG